MLMCTQNIHEQTTQPVEYQLFVEDSQALLISSAILNSIKDIGMPESRILLSHGVMYLSAAKKNKDCYVAIENALGKIN